MEALYHYYMVSRSIDILNIVELVHTNFESVYSLCMCLFLTNLEIPIVTTALIDITTDLGGFDHVNWITSAYLLGYVGEFSSPPFYVFETCIHASRLK